MTSTGGLPAGAVANARAVAGEVWTTLLQHSDRLPEPAIDEVLGPCGTPASERPLPSAFSADTLTGVDCRLPAPAGPSPRVIGTASSRTRIIGGKVVQGSSQVVLTGTAANRRRAWSQYLARPGVVEVLGEPDIEALGRGLAADRTQADPLALGASAKRGIAGVQRSPVLDRRPPFRAARTRLRWAAVAPSGEGPECHAVFTLTGETSRALRVVATAPNLSAVQRFCEDLAHHDWLLTTLNRALVRGDDKDDSFERQRTALEHLAGLWMPGAHTPAPLAPLWSGFEREPGFTRHWESLTGLIRDRVALHTLTLLERISAETGRGGAGAGTGTGAGRPS
ncbi:SCO2521 family protein [Yinghuangia sp. YIM S09857]|uniref:SCO2521 family protein n=1 Tax=Yinghuangia sp. YIM S09857 TaxID=3436929 RepID=UPI003F52DB7C